MHLAVDHLEHAVGACLALRHGDGLRGDARRAAAGEEGGVARKRGDLILALRLSISSALPAQEVPAVGHQL